MSTHLRLHTQCPTVPLLPAPRPDTRHSCLQHCNFSSCPPAPRPPRESQEDVNKNMHSTESENVWNWAGLPHHGGRGAGPAFHGRVARVHTDRQAFCDACVQAHAPAAVSACVGSRNHHLPHPSLRGPVEPGPLQALVASLPRPAAQLQRWSGIQKRYGST